MQRPKGIEITTWLIALALAVEVIQTVILWNSTVALHPTKDVPLQEALNVTRGFYVFMISVSTVALSFYWKGRERARRIILVDCVLCLFRLTGLIIPEIRKISRFNEAAVGCQAGLAICLLCYLFTPAVSAWFTERTKTDTELNPVSATPGLSESDIGINAHRPKGVEITAWLMAFFLVAEVFQASILWNSVAYIHLKPGTHSTKSVHDFARVASVVTIVISTLSVWFYWEGRRWARDLVLFASCIELYTLLKIQSYWQNSHFTGVMTVARALLAVFLFWYLFRSDVRRWFAEQTKLAAPNRALKPAPL